LQPSEIKALSQIDRAAYQNYLFPMPFPKKGITYKAVQPMAARLTHADDEETLSRRSFLPAETRVESAWDWSDRRVCRRCERGAPCLAWGKKKMGGTKMVRAVFDDAGGQRFSGLQD